MRDSTKTALVATTVHNPLDNRIFFKQIGSLIDAGWTVQYLCRRDGCPGDAPGLDVQPVSLPAHRLLRLLAGNVILFWKGLFSSAGVLHVHDPELFLVARLLSFRFSRVIIDLHDLPHEQVRYKPYLRDVVKKPMSWLVELFLKVLLFRATVVVAESSYIEWVSKVTRHHVLVRNFPMVERIVRAEPISHVREHVTLGYVGVISRARRIEPILDSLPLIEAQLGRRVSLKLIGGFESEGLRKKVVSKDGVSYLGYQPNTEAHRLLQDADIGLALTARTPNYDHSLSTKILEYILLGLPVVASDNPINQELFADFSSVRLVDPDAVDAIAAAVIELTLQAPGADALVEARRRVFTEMNWRGEFARLLTCYEARVR